MKFVWPAPGLGALIALVLLILVVLMGFMGMLPKEWVLLVAAICTLKL